jgi:hypothetical protein
MNATPSTPSNEAEMPEAEFLDRQMADAQVAFQRTLSELKSTLREASTLDVWAQRHPWLVAGSALTGGFLLATMLFPPKAQANSMPPAEMEQNGHQNTTAPPRGSSWVLNTLFSLVKPVLGQLVTSLVAAAVGGAAGSMASADQPINDESVTGNPKPPADDGPVPA